MKEECKKCRGACCKLFDKVEIKTQAEFLKLYKLAMDHDKNIVIEFEPAKEKWFFRARGGCPFLHKGKCDIYEMRFEACKIFDCSIGGMQGHVSKRVYNIIYEERDKAWKKVEGKQSKRKCKKEDL